MNLPFFIAKKVIGNQNQSFAKLIIRIAIIAIALGMSVMIVATSLIRGFKEEISSKIFGFRGHVHIMDYEAVRSNSYETFPISIDQDFYPDLDTIGYARYPAPVKILGYEFEDWVREKETKGGVDHIQMYVQKIGVIKTKKEIEGIIIKGIGKDYNWEHLQKFIKEGEILLYNDTLKNDGIIISEQTAKRLELSLGNRLLVYFVTGDDQIQKRFEVKGIYKTGLEEYDTKFALIDLRVLQDVYGWKEDQVSGFEVFVENIDDLEPLSEVIYDNLPMDLYSSNIKDMEPNIFGWLDLQNTTEVFILVLMIIVGIINMVTALIILILERTNMIGILKAMGAKNAVIRHVFLYYGAYITSIGLLIGNIIGISLCLIQKYAKIIRLPEEDYYVSVAPISLDFLLILGLNIGTLIITVLVLIIPSILVNFIAPVKAIRFK